MCAIIKIKITYVADNVEEPIKDLHNHHYVVDSRPPDEYSHHSKVDGSRPPKTLPIKPPDGGIRSPKVTQSSNSAIPPSQEPDEIVDVKIESLDDGGMRLEFESHNKAHKLNLIRSGQQLGDIPINILGMSQREVGSHMKDFNVSYKLIV